ncbi:tRNA-splicing endonuclease subunit sen54 N-term-domain-containing protein [Cubamyces lactineus]|nr:tRNA-splicing endonuclease subunit sen54 N-term-domain-containing protein [Cubamyces lactineus]
MDDNLETPFAAPKPDIPQEREEDEQSSGDEDQGPDWTKIPGLNVARPVIPKRGEKDFEPIAQGGSGLQRHVLDRSRAAMLEALKATRTISYKSVSHAIWYPELSRAHVTVARGIHFTTMGHSVARPAPVPEDTKKMQKRLELLPEEALYLVERGAMYCWKPTDEPIHHTAHLDDMEGVPMTVQQAFAEMVGTEDLTLEKYQVYAYLKRLGYVVTRAKPPSSDYPVPPPFPSKARTSTSILARSYGAMTSLLARLVRVFSTSFDWWRPIRCSRWLHHNMSNASLYKSLRFLPSGHDVPLHIQRTPETPPSPYEIFFHLYKPSTPFKKTAPPPPDFSVVVVNARTSPMPTISELTDLFGQLPELPPPAPRKRVSFAQQKLAASSAASSTPSQAKASAPAEQSLSTRAMAWLWPPSWFGTTQKGGVQTRPPNPFPSLKMGNKVVVIAAVDAGTISFFRFGQGVFTEWPMA